MEGTLSLFDWRPSPAPTALASAPASNSNGVAVADSPLANPAATVGLRVVVFDCETTGIDHSRDQVIELCVQHGLAEDARRTTWRIRPSVPIHPAAQAVHGISIEELAACPTFGEVADEIAAVFADVDVFVGYNLAFDIDMLQAEYGRISRPMLDLTGKKIVDAFRLWQQFEPRSLQHAHKRFVGDAFADAHSASADVAATGRVLAGMLRAFKLDGQDWSEIASVCDPTNSFGQRASWVGPSRHLRWENGSIVVGFGKYQGSVLHELAAGPDRSFLRWVIDKDFPVHVGEVCKTCLELAPDAFLAWARERFGQAAPTTLPPFAASGSPRGAKETAPAASFGRGSVVGPAGPRVEPTIGPSPRP